MEVSFENKSIFLLKRNFYSDIGYQPLSLFNNNNKIFTEEDVEDIHELVLSEL